MRAFVHESSRSRVVFGTGTIAGVRGELERLSRSNVLLVSTPSLAPTADRVASAVRPAARFDGAVMHTPVEVTERVLRIVAEHRVDCVLAIGGGSTTGLAKALAARTDIAQVIVPTTYAGSEVTDILGETRDGLKATRSGPEILPETVIYDVELTLGLPVGLSVTSGINALAHAVEALYAPDSNPLADATATAAIERIATTLPAVVAEPAGLEARAGMLEAAWLAGGCLRAVTMGLHHKLCHAVAGPHSATHTVILPHVMAYQAPAVPEAMGRIANALGRPDAPAGVFDLVSELGGPTSLRDLGVPESDLPGIARRVNPAVEWLLTDAWHGRRPATGCR